MNPVFEPYYAVIFTSTHKEKTEGYAEMALKMEKLATKQKGFMGIDSAKTNLGITNSYWASLEDIKNWKQQTDHLLAQQKGKTDWYSWYHVRICKVEREYEFNAAIN
jgi:heme-degrading monooxygenase HmoA